MTPRNGRDFILRLQGFTARSMVTHTALRNSGAPGVVDAAQEFLSVLRLRGLTRINGGQYLTWLDLQTDRLRNSLPIGAQKWGPARKALNIFMRSVAYTVPLSEEYGLESILRYLEVPLDKDVATALRKTPEGAKLPRWISIVGLTPEKHQLYQHVAMKVARTKRVHRADLDVYYWAVK